MDVGDNFPNFVVKNERNFRKAFIKDSLLVQVKSFLKILINFKA